jgi:non-ribosomal peptide synthase protein (TIGR01720 family)
MSADAEVRAALGGGGGAVGSAEISFNYLGQLDQVLTGSELFAGVGRENSGWGRAAEECREYVLDIGGSVVGGRLQLQLVYSGRVLRRERVAELGRQVQAALEELIEARAGAETNIFTPSDFPEAKLSQAELDQLVAELAGIDE